MKKVVYLVSFLCLLFIACRNSINNDHEDSLIRKTQKELEKLQEPTEGVENLEDDFSGCVYIWENNPRPTNHTYELHFDKENNKVSLISEITQNGEKIGEFRWLVCLRNVDNARMKLDFTPFETYAKNYNIDTYLDYCYDSVKSLIEMLEKKSNRTIEEEKHLEEAKKYLPYYSTIEKYKELDPDLRGYKIQKLRWSNSAKAYKEINPMGAISPDKSTIAFPKFFFFDFKGDLEYEVPKIHENVVFKKR